MQHSQIFPSISCLESQLSATALTLKDVPMHLPTEETQAAPKLSGNYPVWGPQQSAHDHLITKMHVDAIDALCRGFYIEIH